METLDMHQLAKLLNNQRLSSVLQINAKRIYAVHRELADWT